MSEPKWFELGQLQSPVQRLGIDKMLYSEDKKKQLFTDTKNYITQKNTFLQDELPKINADWKTFMERDDLKDIPISDRTALADRLASSRYAEIKKISEELWPNADMGYKQQANLNTAQNVVDGNIVAKAAPKKRGRKPKAQKIAKAPKTEKIAKAPAKKRGRPKKAAK
jgi:hypothetical protein